MLIANYPPLVAILRGISLKEVAPVAEVLYAAGFRYLEIPLNSPDPYVSIARLVEVMGARACCGAGTVVSLDQAQQVIDTGAQLMVMPNTDVNIITLAKQAGMVTMPGALTPTEIFSAIHTGASAVKLFPIGGFGSGYVKQVKSVMPVDVNLFAVGGINPRNMAEYHAAGCSGFGIGGDLYRSADDIDTLKLKASAIMASYQSLVCVTQV